MEYIARYRIKNLSQFKQRFAEGDFVRLVIEAEAGIPKKALKELAIKASPRGYEFIEVIKKI